MSSSSSDPVPNVAHEVLDQSITMKDEHFGKFLASSDYQLVRDLLVHQTLLTIEPNRTLDRALRMMMLQNIRHLPVVTKHTRELVGLISERDLRLASASPLFDKDLKSEELMKKLTEHKVRECMSRSVHTVNEDETILTAAKLMRVSKRGALVVLSASTTTEEEEDTTASSHEKREEEQHSDSDEEEKKEEESHGTQQTQTKAPSRRVVGIITRMDLLDHLIRVLEPISKEEQEKEMDEKLRH